MKGTRSGDFNLTTREALRSVETSCTRLMCFTHNRETVSALVKPIRNYKCTKTYMGYLRCDIPEIVEPKSTFYIVLSLINLDLIIIFSTLFKKKNYLTNTCIIIVLLFPIAAIYRSTRRIQYDY
jgi:beta-lactamase class D